MEALTSTHRPTEAIPSWRDCKLLLRVSAPYLGSLPLRSDSAMSSQDMMWVFGSREPAFSHSHVAAYSWILVGGIDCGRSVPPLNYW